MMMMIAHELLSGRISSHYHQFPVRHPPPYTFCIVAYRYFSRTLPSHSILLSVSNGRVDDDDDDDDGNNPSSCCCFFLLLYFFFFFFFLLLFFLGHAKSFTSSSSSSSSSSCCCCCRYCFSWDMQRVDNLMSSYHGVSYDDN